MSEPTRLLRNPTWESVQDTPHLTYRQFDHWASKGYIRFTFERGNGGSGDHRVLSQHEMRVIALMADLVNAGLVPARAVLLARQLATEGIGHLGPFTIVAQTPPTEKEPST